MIVQVNGKLYEHHYDEYLQAEVWQKLPEPLEERSQ